MNDFAAEVKASLTQEFVPLYHHYVIGHNSFHHVPASKSEFVYYMTEIDSTAKMISFAFTEDLTPGF